MTGKEILLNAYWGKNGWKDGTVSKEDFIKAKNECYMFDYPEAISHTETIERLKEVVGKIKKEDVANAFLYSLSTRELAYRSAFASYYYAISIRKHRILTDDSKNSNHCKLCRWYKWKETPNDYELKHGVNVFNFERFKFGGVRHDSLNYVLFDLEQFFKMPKVIPTNNDREMLNKIMNCVKKLHEGDKVGKLRDVILKEKIIKANKNEIGILLDILGIAGILSSKIYPSYNEAMINVDDRGPEEYKNDFLYPVNRWKFQDGINKKRFLEVFSYEIVE